MVCSNCGSSNPEGNRFCGQCGAQLPQAETLIAPVGPVSSAFRKEVEKQQYQLRQLQRRAEDRGVASETNATPEPGRRATDRKVEQEQVTMVDSDAPGWRSGGLSDEPAWQSSQPANFEDETIVGDARKDGSLHATAYSPFSQETRVIDTRPSPDEVAAEREYEEPPISGPSFLGLGHTESEANSNSNLAYLYEDEPRSGRARYWIAAIIVLACVGFFVYEWKQNWNWDTTIIGRHRAQQADAGKPAGGTDANPSAPDTGNAKPSQSADAAEQSTAGAQSAPAVQGDAAAGSTNTPPTPDKSASTTPPAGTPAAKSPATPDSQTASAKPAKPGVTADQAGTSAKGPDKGSASAAEPGAAGQNSADAEDEAATDNEPENGGDEVADATPPKSAKRASQTKPATSRYAEKEPGSDLVAKADKYLYGRGVAKNCDQALVYLRTAANRGNAEARSKLGGLYATGHCVSMDRAEAYNWFTLAREAGSKNVWVERNREMLWSQMTPAEKERTLGP